MPRPAPRPLSEASLSHVEVLFTDVDGTMTTHDRLQSETIAALETLQNKHVRVVLVSGRPAGWGECWARTLPVDGVIVENGGLWFARDADGALRKKYYEPEASRRATRARLEREVAAVLADVPGARLSSDSAYTEVDLAIDHNEEAALESHEVDRIEELLRARGVTAVRSSVHVNCWLGDFDKCKAVERFLAEELGTTLARRDERFVYVGDSFNDAPMFARFPLSIGVANVLRVLDRIDTPPAFVTREAEGAGLREVVAAMLRR